VVLADDFVNTAWAKAVGQGAIRLLFGPFVNIEQIRQLPSLWLGTGRITDFPPARVNNAGRRQESMESRDLRRSVADSAADCETKRN
jgi:hypothetical protein